MAPPILVPVRDHTKLQNIGTNTHDQLDTAVGLNTTHRTSSGADHSYIDQSVVSGASPTLVGTNITAIPATNVEFQVIGTPTYHNAQHWFDVVQSSGIIDGFVISAGDDVTHVDVSAGKGIIKSTDSELGTTISFEVGATNELELSALSVNYIYVDYNAGTPIVAATTNYAAIELNRMFLIGLVYSNVASIHILNAGIHVSNLARTEHERLVEKDGFTYVSGAVTTKSTLDLITTGGVWYYGHNRLTTDPLDTTGVDTFNYIHYGTSAWIVDDAAASAVDATHYNDGDDIIGDLGVNNYGVQWLYVTADSHYYLVYGTENGTLAAAEAAVPPSQAHPYITPMGELIAKIIVRQTGVIISIQQVHDVMYTASVVPNHNDLGGLQGGAANDYYHLLATELSKLSGIEASADVTDAVNIASSIVGVDGKTPPVDADTIPIIDSEASNVLKELTWANVKATLKTYFDTLYNLYVHPNHSGDVTSVADGATTIAAGAVDIAMLANGTDGQLITWDADGAPDVVATGTATHVLTSNGAGAAPTFQASPAGFADPMTTRGDIIVRKDGGTDRLALGSNGQVLSSDGTDILWAAGGGGAATETLWFPAESFYLPVTNPAALTEEAGATVYAGQSHLDFDDTTAEHAVVRGPVIDYDGGNMVITATAKVASTPAGAVTLIFDIYAVGIANSEAYDTAVTVDTGVDLTFNLDTTELLTDLFIATATIDPANVSDGDKLVIEFIRNVSDTLVGDGELVDFKIEYTRA